MKATGIVRRIDELGRVVIPKEIRRTLRIREADPLEIYTDREGGIILKKYSPVGELSEHAGALSAALYATFQLPCAVCDRDVFVASAGLGKRDPAGKAVSTEIEAMMLTRTRIVSLTPDERRWPLLSEDDPAYRCAAIVGVPVVTQGDAIGGMLLFSQKPDQPIDASAVKACEAAAAFLAKQMEE